MGVDKLRVMQVLEATVGGTRHYLLDLAYNLPAAQFDQHLIVSALRDPGFADDIQRLRAAGVHVTEVPMRRNISPGSDWTCYRKIRQIIGAWRPHVIHSHSSKAGFLARMAARGMPCASLYSPHCFAFQMRVCPRRRVLYTQLERFAGRYTDTLVLACESQRRIAVAQRIVPADSIAIIPTGIRASDYQSQADRDQLRDKLGVSGSRMIVGSVAALTPQKGHRYLLAAMAEMGRETDAILLLAGTGNQQSVLLAQAESLDIENRVMFLGQRDDIADLLKSLDLFVLPSLWEGLPYGLLEAMAAGVPVVTTDIAGNTDLIDGHTTGWLVPPADAAALARAIGEALANPTEADSRAAAARRLVESDYTLENMIAEYVKLYAEVGDRYRE